MTNVTEPADNNSARSTKRVITWVARAIGYLLYAYLIFVEIILLTGFLLLLFGANPSSGFVEWIYRSLDRVMEPFSGIFSPIELGLTGTDVEAVFDTSVLFAMVIYGIVALVIHAGIDYFTRVINRIDREQAEEDRRRAYSDAIRRTQAPTLDPTLPQMPAQPTPVTSTSTTTTPTTTTPTTAAPAGQTPEQGSGSVPPPPQ